MRAVAFLPTFVLKTLVWFFFDKSKTEGLGHIRLEPLVIVVDGSLAPDDRFPFCRVGLFFPYEKVELIDVLQGYIIKYLELAESFKCFIGGEMPFTSTFTKRTVVDTLPKTSHEVTAVATVLTQISLELGNCHVILIHLHDNKDMLKLSYFLLNFLVDDNDTRMIHHHTILH